MSKVNLRKQMKDLRLKLSSNEVRLQSENIYNKLILNQHFLSAEIVLLYIDYKNEVKTNKILEYCFSHNKMVAVPKIKDNEMDFYYINSLNDLDIGAFGIMEPITNALYCDINKKTVMIMPGVAFDRMCSRIGYGGGYYDRFLSKHSNLYTIALGYEFQVVDEIQSDEYDIKPNILITEQNIYLYKR